MKAHLIPIQNMLVLCFSEAHRELRLFFFFYPTVISLNKTPQIKTFVEIKPHQSVSLIVLNISGLCILTEASLWHILGFSYNIMSETLDYNQIPSSLDQYYKNYCEQRVQRS